MIANVGDSRIEAKLVHNDNTILALAELSKESGKLGLNSHLESTFHSFGRIDLTGKVSISLTFNKELFLTLFVMFRVFWQRVPFN